MLTKAHIVELLLTRSNRLEETERTLNENTEPIYPMCRA